MTENENLGSLNIDTSIYKTRISKKYASRKPYAPADPSKLMSFIPGTVVDILVKVGMQVKKGDTLVILDAMKMQNHLNSATDGKVKAVHVSKGDRVAKGVILIELEMQ
jgi:biotin carboxyl carrier protein